MIYFIELLKGVIIAIGIIIGMLAVLVIIMSKAQKVKYKAEELLPAFALYLNKIQEEEWYEQRTEVLEIIKELTKGNVPESIEKYHIKKEVLIHTESHGNGSTFRFESKYTVLELKPVE